MRPRSRARPRQLLPGLCLLLSIGLATPPGLDAQEPKPIGGEWAPYTCPMPVHGMGGPGHASTHPDRDEPGGARLDGTRRDDARLLRDFPTPVLSRRCFNPLAVRTMPPETAPRLRLQMEPTPGDLTFDTRDSSDVLDLDVLDLDVLDLFEPLGRTGPHDDPFGLDDGFAPSTTPDLSRPLPPR